MSAPTVGASVLASTLRRRRQALITVAVVAVGGVWWASRTGLLGGHDREPTVTATEHAASDVFGPVTPDQAQAFAAKLQPALRDCPAGVDALLDDQAVTAIAVGDKSLPDATMAAIAKGARGQLSAALCVPGVTSTALGVHDLGTGPYVVVRVELPQHARFWQLELGAGRRDGQVRVVDARDLSYGIRLSASIRDQIDLYDQYSAPELTAVIDQLNAVQNQAPDRIRELIPRLPEAVQATRAVRLMALWTAAPGTVKAERERYRALCPDAIQVQIDSALARGDATAARQALDDFERRVGVDPFLELERAPIEIVDRHL